MLAVAQYLFFTVQTARARGRTGLEAPAVSGSEEFERYFRAQQNTLEQLAVFLPSLFATGYFVSPGLGAAVGAVFILGRGLYFSAYIRDPESRRAGVVISFGSNAILCITGIVGSLIETLRSV